MRVIDRRGFVICTTQGAMAAATAAALAQEESAPLTLKVKPLQLAFVGIHGRGGYLARKFAARDDCEVRYLCDVDESLLAPCAKDVEQLQGNPPMTVGDFRRALDDRQVDGIVVATPDHWHALATVWGCQAGKDVYVEKPVSHSPWEGRKMIEAARHYERIVQVGTQNRSAPYNIAAKQFIDSGKLGTVHLVKVFNQKSWPNFPAIADGPAPRGLDWDMWTGPAPQCSYNENFHRRWNHFWRFSGGDIINDGVHQIDLARWLVGKAYPESVYSTGGRYAEPGVCESPDTQVAVFQFDDLVMVFELTLYTPYMIKSDQVLRDSDQYPYWPQNAERIEIYGSQGLMIVGRHGCGWQVYDRPKDRQPVIVAQGNGPFPDDVHFDDFVQSAHSRQLPNADIEQGHLSTLLCQWANISYRLNGRKLLVDAATETFLNDIEANSLLKREYRDSWVVPDKV